MFPTVPTEMATLAKSQCAAQLELLATLNGMALESVSKLVELNMNITKQTLINSTAVAQQLMHAGNGGGAPEWTRANALEQDVGNVLSYTRQAADIALGMQAEVAKLAQESVDETTRKMQEMIQDAAKRAPKSDANPANFMRTAMTQINDGYAQWAKMFGNSASVMQAASKPTSGAHAKK